MKNSVQSIFIVVFLILPRIQGGIFVEIMKHAPQCMEDSGTNEEMIERSLLLELENDMVFKRFLKCILERTNILVQGNVINIKKVIVGLLDEVRYDSAAPICACSRAGGDDEYEKAFNFSKCIIYTLNLRKCGK